MSGNNTIYVRSIGAMVVRLFGYGMIGVGISGIASGLVGGGIVMIVIGLILGVWASSIQENKCFEVWKKQMEEKNLIPAIQSDVDVAIKAYNAYPNTKTLEYIRTLNPAAAQRISELIAEKNQNNKK